MRVPLTWLRELIDLPTNDVTELGAILAMLGHKVEGIEVLEVPWTDVVVGRVLEVSPHPNADNIRLCQVEAGGAPEQIVCGAWNFEAGAHVTVARPGATLPGGHVIGRREIRGVVSNGMICSERELGLGDDHQGILVLDGKPPIGAPFETLLELPDIVFDLEITTNRPDALSILGIARDLGAHFGIMSRLPDTVLATSGQPTRFRVDIEDPVGCQRFTLREIEGVTVDRSPLWLRHRLAKVGVRPISNVVDVTNYVMFELGHPLHVFDADTVAGERLVIRRASVGEKLETLDHVMRDLGPEDLIIYDAEGPTSMSGTMGGARSEVSATTTRILMEAASWDPPTIMRMSRRHDLRSEASARFERGVDPGLADLANRRATALVSELGGGSVLDEAVDVVTGDITPIVVELRTTDVERVLGAGFDTETITDILGRLGMTVEGGEPMRVTVPTFRPDLTRPVDLVEEVARLHGYDRFDATVPTGGSGGLTVEQRRQRVLVSTLVGAGLDQAICLPFVGVEEASALGYSAGELLTVRNPLREEESKLRVSLLPGLLAAVRHNVSYGASGVGLFEMGTVFTTVVSDDDPRLPHQPERLAWAIIGEVGMQVMAEKVIAADAHVSLGLLRLIGLALDVDFETIRSAPPGFHPGRTAEVRIAGTAVGHVGELSPLTASRFDLGPTVAAAELDLAPLVAPREPHTAVSPSIYPHVDYDLSFRVDADLPSATLVQATIDSVRDLVETCRVFDEFWDSSLGEGKKALAITYRLRAPDRTLTAGEIGRIRARMIEAAIDLGAELRGS